MPAGSRFPTRLPASAGSVRQRLHGLAGGGVGAEQHEQLACTEPVDGVAVGGRGELEHHLRLAEQRRAERHCHEEDERPSHEGALRHHHPRLPRHDQLLELVAVRRRIPRAQLRHRGVRPWAEPRERPDGEVLGGVLWIGPNDAEQPGSLEHRLGLPGARRHVRDRQGGLLETCTSHARAAPGESR